VEARNDEPTGRSIPDRPARSHGGRSDEPGSTPHGSAAVPSGAASRPAGLCTGRGHVVAYGNPAFVTAFGEGCVGVPAREAFVGMSREGFALFDEVLRSGRPLARWVRLGSGREPWRLVVAPRVDPGTREVYGVRFHMRARSDVPVLLPDGPGD